MAKNTLKTELESHTKQYEDSLREAERQLAAVVQKDILAQARVGEIYLELAKFNLSNRVNLTHDAHVQLELRAQEEASTREAVVRVEAEITASTEGLSRAEADLSAVNEKLEQFLHTDSAYLKNAEDLAVAEHKAAAIAGLSSEITTECDTKLPLFQQDIIFSYLQRSGYSSPSYARRGVFKGLDRWLAGLVNFEQNNANYQSLKGMKSALVERKYELEKTISGLKQKVLERAMFVKLSLNFEPAQRSLSVAKETLARQKAEAKRLQVVLQEYVGRSDSRYERAYKSIAAAMESVPLRDLKAAAQETLDQQDDAVVSELEKQRHVLSGLAIDISKLTQIRNDRDVKYQRAKIIERSLRAERFSGPDYKYSRDFDLSLFLAGYMAGDLSSDVVTKSMLDQRIHVPAPARVSQAASDSTWGASSGRSSASSESGGSRSSSSSDYSTGDSFGGDSYSTGDSF
jgi:hypothetical protein